MHINLPSGLDAKIRNWKLHWSDPRGYSRDSMPGKEQNGRNTLSLTKYYIY